MYIFCKTKKKIRANTLCFNFFISFIKRFQLVINKFLLNIVLFYFQKIQLCKSATCAKLTTSAKVTTSAKLTIFSKLTLLERRYLCKSDSSLKKSTCRINDPCKVDDWFWMGIVRVGTDSSWNLSGLNWFGLELFWFELIQVEND